MSYTNFTICVNYKSQIIKDYFRDGKSFGVKISLNLFLKIFFKEKTTRGKNNIKSKIFSSAEIFISLKTLIPDNNIAIKT